jgi:20S proteasome alpha/beta subunit
MTIIVSIKINDGIVMAADSVSSFASGMSYQHANKIVNLRKGLPLGAMVTGNGGIGSESIETLLKDLRRRFNGDDVAHQDWALDPQNFTLQAVSERLRTFLYDEKTVPLNDEIWMKIRICGYSAGRPLSEVWEVNIRGRECAAPALVQEETSCGPLWEGEQETLNRLIIGLGSDFSSAIIKLGLMTEQQATEAARQLPTLLYRPLVMHAMPIQDAIHLARFLVETTIGMVKFSIDRTKTVGGPIEIAVITKHEGFKWVDRKHFFPPQLNPPSH